MSRLVRSLVVPGCVAGFVLVFASGCGSGTATATGIVTFQGKPVPGGSVVFYCADKQIVRGLIGTDGRYSIPNVPCGPATVTVQSPSRLPAGMQMRQNLPPTKDGPIAPTQDTASNTGHGGAIPPRYGVPDESGLSVVVERGQLKFDIDLKP